MPGGTETPVSGRPYAGAPWQLVALEPFEAEIPAVEEIPTLEVTAPEAEVAPVKAAPSPPEAAAPQSADEVTARLVDEVRSLPSKIELPSRLFSLVADRLGITKGALMLFDHGREVYAPWAFVGYDPTTHRRLRIPGPTVEATAAVANREPMAVTDAAGLAQFQQFFSTREFGGIEHLLLAPLSTGGKLHAFFLVTEATPPFEPEALLGCLGRVAAAAAPAVQEVRERLPGALLPQASPAEAEAAIDRQLAASVAAGSHYLVFQVSLADWEGRLLATLRNLDPFRLEQDLRAVVSNFVSGAGVAVHLGGARFIAAVRGLAAADLDLFSHQLAALLGTLFGELEPSPADVVLGEPRPFPPEQ